MTELLKTKDDYEKNKNGALPYITGGFHDTGQF